MKPILLNHQGIALVSCYLLSLLLVGWLARRASRESSLSDYYLAGGSLGIPSLFFTLYATQYSGNSLFALPGKAYREGIMASAFIVGVMGIVLVYQLYAPRLLLLAKQHSFISVGDFVRWRYRNNKLVACTNLVLAACLVTFILGNLKAVGLLVESTSDGAISFNQGILVLCLIMAIYEALGGMRGVIWTDIIQGLILMSGCLLIFYFLLNSAGEQQIISPAESTIAVREFFGQPGHSASFFSLALLIAFGAAFYPQAIQRIYAARDNKALTRSYLLMFFMPLVTTLPIFIIGLSAADWYADLSRTQSEQVVIYAIGDLVTQNQSFHWLLTLYIAAAIAAIMSTIDSALLSLGSIISKDLVQQQKPLLSDLSLHRISKRISWMLMAIMAALAIYLPQTIWSLLVLKLELIIQIAPLMILGVRNTNIDSNCLLAGLVAGVTSAIALKIFGVSPLGIHGGLWALIINILACYACQQLKPRLVLENPH
jgi:Na+/proline symporter